MAAPDTLSIGTHRDRKNWWQSVWIRRTLLLIPAFVVILGIANTFGQRPVTSVASGSAARLTVYAPKHGRSGLVYAARFRIDAIRELRKAMLVLDPGWAEGYTVNGLSPQPLSEGSADGRLVYGFGHIPRRSHLTFWISLQINPTNIGRHPQDVWLYNGHALIAHVKRTMTIFP